MMQSINATPNIEVPVSRSLLFVEHFPFNNVFLVRALTPTTHLLLGVVHILRNHFWGSGEAPPPLCNIVIIWLDPPLCNSVFIWRAPPLSVIT